MENGGLNPGDFLILALAAGPIKGCSTNAELRWWVEPFLTNNFTVATPMIVLVRFPSELIGDQVNLFS